MKLYKWVSNKNTTYHTEPGYGPIYHRWVRDKYLTKPSKEHYRLCSSDVFHAFPTITHAILYRSVCVNSSYNKLWECDGNIVVRDTEKVGSTDICPRRMVYGVPKVLPSSYYWDLAFKLEGIKGDNVYDKCERLLCLINSRNKINMNCSMGGEFWLESILEYRMNASFYTTIDEIKDYESKKNIWYFGKLNRIK